jgi:hypothetical protein
VQVNYIVNLHLGHGGASVGKVLTCSTVLNMPNGIFATGKGESLGIENGYCMLYAGSNKENTKELLFLIPWLRQAGLNHNIQVHEARSEHWPLDACGSVNGAPCSGRMWPRCAEP